MVKKVYLLLITVGVVVPYYFMIRYSIEVGFHWPQLVDDIFNNDFSTVLVFDLLLSVVAYLIFLFREAKKLQMMKQAWICVLVLCAIGMCASLPLFLYLRERVKSPVD